MEILSRWVVVTVIVLLSFVFASCLTIAENDGPVDDPIVAETPGEQEESPVLVESAVELPEREEEPVETEEKDPAEKEPLLSVDEQPYPVDEQPQPGDERSLPEEEPFCGTEAFVTLKEVTQPDQPEEDAVVYKQKEAPAPLSPAKIYRLIFDKSEEGWNPLHRNGVPVLLYDDIDNNGYKDVFVLYLQIEERENADIELVSDFSRLYDLDIKPFSVVMQLFFQQQGELIHGYSVDFGKKVVLEEINAFVISETVETPFSVFLSFQTPEGTERTWVFCRDTSFEELSLQETFASFLDIRDIDTDGLTDILYFEKSYEDGLGYETYISWYNWDDPSYTIHQITGIVRNLKKFLTQVKSFLVEESWVDIIGGGLLPEQLHRLNKKKITDEEIIQLMFISTNTDGWNDEVEIVDLDIEDVIYPEILENPFQKDRQGNYMFPFRVRVIAETGEYFYISRIRMNDNPFEPQQFNFVLMSEDVYN